MPIRPYLGSKVFEPELTRAMGEAFERACQELSLKPGKTDQRTTLVAELIIAAAEGEETDPAKLCEAALRYVPRTLPLVGRVAE